MGVLCTAGSLLQGLIFYAATKEILRMPKTWETCIDWPAVCMSMNVNGFICQHTNTVFISTCFGVGSDGSFSMTVCGSPVQRLLGFSLETIHNWMFSGRVSVITAFYFPSLWKDMQCSLKRERQQGFPVFFPLAMYPNVLAIHAVYLLTDWIGRDTACSDSEGTVENSGCHGGFT